MKQRSDKRSSIVPGSKIVLGRTAFEKISAVEGIKLSKMSVMMFSSFDRQGLSAEERRRYLLEKHAKKA